MNYAMVRVRRSQLELEHLDARRKASVVFTVVRAVSKGRVQTMHETPWNQICGLVNRALQIASMNAMEHCKNEIMRIIVLKKRREIPKTPKSCSFSICSYTSYMHTGITTKGEVFNASSRYYISDICALLKNTGSTFCIFFGIYSP